MDKSNLICGAATVKSPMREVEEEKERKRMLR
jgi:hypothetical protein